MQAVSRGSPCGRELLPRIIRGAIPHIPDHTYDRGPDSPKQAPYDEPYILPENLFNTYELTGDRQFLDMARLYLLDQEYFDPLAQGRNLLPGKHAYSHVIALSSAAKAYEVLGDAKYLNAIRNAWDMLEETQQFASGGWGPKEAFVPPHEGKLGESLTTTREHFETPCGCYAHMKLARYLLRFTGDARYGDGLERVLYNTILGSIEPDERRRLLLLLGLPVRRAQGLLQEEVALLLRHAGAGRRRLRHQHLLPGLRRRLRQLLHTFRGALEDRPPDSRHAVPGRRFRPIPRGCAEGDRVRPPRAHARMALALRLAGGERKISRHRRRARILRDRPPALESATTRWK